ncbi:MULTISPECIES: DUF58 domain-containing protein [unclassified Imperialibacter]|jgi:uncharacterized protein (DUF58 family)|uniref:DUF58 domain-containing protein n=1 Tax=unclassified Imperialibacter TaxID=2629706 RepID=UPI00125B1CFF|nr:MULTISPECIES: DUF58 domain-containing protein [unclassified Imperialibacter]CAD5251839.1 conserved hypothetical protein [Imperialibacter sp. 89]CAD5265322.1 conserved hypothetical protein [Imperialibacter sp. 75]VVT03119.1 conserved hypothetical protein [Imperialibacter sp. EC-SDR9]
MKDFLKKLRRYEIEIRKAITSQMQGDFHSIFKGSGLEFDDVRQYQYGDDIRTIDWNVTAKGHGTFVKTFKEEKEQTVFFILDVSASQEIGADGQQKIDIGKELCGLLALSAIKEGSQVGVLCYSDQKEKYIKPAKGLRHAYQIIDSLFNLKPSSTGTNLNLGIRSAMNMIHRKSVIIMISDFVDDDYQQGIKALAKKHDLVVIHLSDRRETHFPRLGIVPLYDKESKKTIWVNTSAPAFRKKVETIYQGNQYDLEKLCKKNQANYLSISTEEEYVPKLIRLFRVRNKVRKSG